MLLNPLLTAWMGCADFPHGGGWAGRVVGDDDGVDLRPAHHGLAVYAELFQRSRERLGAFAAGSMAWWLYSQSGRKLYLFGAGWPGPSPISRAPSTSATLPIYGLGLLLVLWPTFHAVGATLPGTPAPFSGAGGGLSTFAILVVAAGLVSLWWNWARYGSIWDNGATWRRDLQRRLVFGPLADRRTGRGILWYNPILLLAIPGALWFWRHQRRILAALRSADRRLFRRLRQVVHVAWRL